MDDDTIQEFRHGYGIQYWTDGAHYEGQWSYNKAEGQGTFWHAEGDVYKGEFKNGKKHGWFKYYLNRKFEGRGYAINGEIFFHFVVPKDDGSVEYYE